MVVTTIVVVSYIIIKYGNTYIYIMIFAVANLVALFIAMAYYTNKSIAEFIQETEEKTKSDTKFKACFNNLRESIILISNGQIEYVNSNFLELFAQQINLSN